MIFSSFDTIKNQNLITEINNVDVSTIHLFIQTWVPDYLMRSVRSATNYHYSFFRWDKIMKFSLSHAPHYYCYGAFTNNHLDGLLCLHIHAQTKVEYIATAPWNYSKHGIMRRIGSGLIYYSIISSENNGNNGEFTLNALPDAEPFYQRIGMVATGSKNQAGLNEYQMVQNNSLLYKEKFKHYIIES